MSDLFTIRLGLYFTLSVYVSASILGTKSTTDILHRLYELERQSITQQSTEELIHQIKPVQERDEELMDRIKALEYRDRHRNNKMKLLEDRDAHFRNRIRLLEYQNVQLSDRVRILEDRDALQSNKIKLLEAGYSKLKDKINYGDGHHGNNSNKTYLTANYCKICFEEEGGELSRDNSEDIPMSHDIDSQVGVTDSSLQYQDSMGSSYKCAHNRKRHSSEKGSTVAFFATKSTNDPHLRENKPIVFDKLITNVGLAYNNSTGIFIAPISGVYVFSMTILAGNEDAAFLMTVNGHTYSNVYVYHTEIYETLSQTAVFSLNKGDNVAIHSAESEKYVHGVDYSTFSGFLLVSTEGQIVVG